MVYIYRAEYYYYCTERAGESTYPLSFFIFENNLKNIWNRFEICYYNSAISKGDKQNESNKEKLKKVFRGKY